MLAPRTEESLHLRSGVDSVPPTQLNSEEKARLGQLEDLIQGSLEKFMLCGKALREVRDRRLFRETYPSFAAYCAGRWSFNEHHGQQLIRSFNVAENLLAGSGALPSDLTESTLRPLSRFSNPELQRNVWQLINSVSEKPTASTVAKVSRSIRQAITEAYGCNGHKPYERSLPPAHELVFLRPITKLAANDDFNPEVICLSIDSQERAWKFAHCCRKISRRCEAVAKELFRRFPEFVTQECRQPEQRVTELTE